MRARGLLIITKKNLPQINFLAKQGFPRKPPARLQVVRKEAENFCPVQF